MTPIPTLSLSLIYMYRFPLPSLSFCLCKWTIRGLSRRTLMRWPLRSGRSADSKGLLQYCQILPANGWGFAALLPALAMLDDDYDFDYDALLPALATLRWRCSMTTHEHASVRPCIFSLSTDWHGQAYRKRAAAASLFDRLARTGRI